MRLTRCHLDQALTVGMTLTLPEAVAQHLLRVLRLREGDACILFNGDGHDCDARIIAVGKRNAQVEITARRAIDNESPLRITLLQGIARGEKMDWIVQKATELGVARILPVVSERSEVRLDGERADRRVAHWREVAISACEQSGRAVLPAVAAPSALDHAATLRDGPPDAFGTHDASAAEQRAHAAADALQQLFEAHPGEICAFILEPLVQCAGGMRMHHPAYLRRARALCDAHGIFLIADEIAVGFGRTGSLFACEQGGIQPDLMCLSKGLTGGFLPLCAVLATQTIFDGFLDDSRERAFLHSHSYSGNPLACAAALASLDILESDHVLERNRAGMILAIELQPEVGNHEDGHAVEISGRRGLRMYRAALEHDVLLRPLGDVLYWMPPYCIDAAQLELLANATRAALTAVAS